MKVNCCSEVAEAGDGALAAAKPPPRSCRSRERRDPGALVKAEGAPIVAFTGLTEGMSRPPVAAASYSPKIGLGEIADGRFTTNKPNRHLFPRFRPPHVPTAATLPRFRGQAALPWSVRALSATVQRKRRLIGADTPEVTESSREVGAPRVRARWKIRGWE